MLINSAPLVLAQDLVFTDGVGQPGDGWVGSVFKYCGNYCGFRDEWSGDLIWLPIAGGLICRRGFSA